MRFIGHVLLTVVEVASIARARQKVEDVARRHTAMLANLQLCHLDLTARKPFGDIL